MTGRFRIVRSEHGELAPDAGAIVLVPSDAFGDGSHETTRMCLQALSVFAPRAPFRLLDVGSGTGILALAATKLSPDVSAVGVEIDEAANVAARESARRNGVVERVAFGTDWPTGTFPIVIANILAGVLVELAPRIVERLAPGGVLVLSGLVSTDVPVLIACYAPRLGARRPEIFERGPWRTLLWRG